MQTELVRIPPATFDDYLHLERDLEFIADLTPPAALNWAEDQQVAGIRGRDPRFSAQQLEGNTSVTWLRGRYCFFMSICS